jgi:nucleoside-diphosphate-sugar epimerase
MQVLVTGASGFVGSAVVRRLSADLAMAPISAVRRPSVVPDAAERVVGDLRHDTDWRGPLTGIEAVVHCAARAHQMHDRAPDPAGAFREVNAAGTCRLAQQAAKQGVRRLVFISSIKVNGEATAPGQAFSEADVPSPQDPYGVSKLEAEQGLGEIARASGMEFVVIRAPLVYGPGAKGNLHRLMSWIARGVPLPLALVRNHRSLIGLDNLTSAIALALTHPEAAGKTYLVSDQEDLSTPELIQALARGMGRKPRLLPTPVGLLRAAGAIAGQTNEVERLVGSLVVNSGLISRDLGWQPPRSPREGLEEMARAFLRLQVNRF